MRIESQRKVKGKIFIQLKSITQKYYYTVYEENTKFEKGIKTIHLSSEKKSLNYKWRPGFYEIFARIVTGEYEYYSDTLTFVFQSDSILFSSTNRVDLETFWLNTFSALDTLHAYFELTEQTDKQHDSIKVFKIMYRSLDTACIKAWYCLPKSDKLLPAILILPSYGNTSVQIPYTLARLGFAVVAIQIHGLDVESDNYPVGDDPSAGQNLDDPNKYYLRKAVASAKRAIDFFYTRSELDTARIGVAGTSQGGGLALLLTGLDSRIKATIATIPTLCCFPEGLESGCCSRVRRSIINGLVDKTTAFRTLSYFDANNFAERFTKPVLLSAHFKDRISTPNTVFALYNRIPSKTKQLIIHSNLGHEFPVNHWDVPYSWFSVVLRKK
ncbi:MAG: acetylxylan esterase [Bacteroidota bacterium]|nr:acetylxylan esterase [Bacteroidota bacterium]